MTNRIHPLLLPAIVISILILTGCSLFRSSGSADDNIAKDDSKERFRLFKTEHDKESQSHLFDEEDFDQYSENDDESLSSDSTFFIESLTFDDTVQAYSNKRLDDSDLAEEIVKESRTLYMLDSLVGLTFFKDDELLFDRDLLNVYNYPEDFVPTFSDSVYQARIAILNREMPLDLTYNKTVRAYIDLYAQNKRGLTSRILGLSEVYFPMFEEILDQYNMPLELKYLAVIESALIPTAGSHAGAKGLWQFMYRTGKVYGLEATSLVDDRFDPYKSTIAAAQHLQDLYNIYQDWWLVLAAYNSGAGNVNKAIRRAGGIKNYWAIWPFLPRETRGYVPAFIAVTYVMNHAAEHNLYPVHPGILYNAIDTIHVHDILYFDQISEFMNIPVEDLKYLNPSFKQGIIPASPDDTYVLRLPRSLSGYFVSHEEEIYSFKSKKGLELEKLLTEVEEVSQRQVHIVKSGENLGSIARRYRTSVANLQAWNNLRSTTIHPGQRLTVYADAAHTGGSQSSASVTRRSGEQSTHTVKKGENLGLIASKYKCSVNDLKNWNNLKSNTIQPNQKLIVYKPTDNLQASSVTASKSSGGDVQYIYHVVKSGDTLWEIAKQYDGVTVDDLKRLNKITNAHSLKPGQKLRVAVAG